MRFILFLVSIPFLAAIGHDIYLNIVNNEEQIKMSAVGFIWMQYSPETFGEARNWVDPQQWALLNDYVLEQKAVLVTGILAGLFYVLAVILKLLTGTRKASVLSGVRNKKIDVILGEATQEGYKYKRK